MVNVNPLYTERELEHQVNDSGMETIFCIDMLINNVRNVKEKTSLKRIVVTRMTDFMIPEARDAAGPYDLLADELGLLDLMKSAGKGLPPVSPLVPEPLPPAFTSPPAGEPPAAPLPAPPLPQPALQAAAVASPS